MKKDLIILIIIILVVVIVGLFGTRWLKLKYQTRLEIMRIREPTSAVTEPTPIFFVQYDGNEFRIYYPNT
jgi:flagellar basal body-associated protein FliL